MKLSRLNHINTLIHLSLESNAYDIFSSSQVETKMAILNIVLANFKLDGQKFSYTHRK